MAKLPDGLIATTKVRCGQTVEMDFKLDETRYWYHIFDAWTGRYLETVAWSAGAAYFIGHMGYLLLKASNAEAD